MTTNALKIAKAAAAQLELSGWILSKATVAFVVLERVFSTDGEVLSTQRLMLNLSFPKHELPDGVHGIVITLQVQFPQVEKVVSELADGVIEDVTFMLSASQFLQGNRVYAGSVLLIDSSTSLEIAVETLLTSIAPLLEASEIAADPAGLLNSRMTSLVSKRFFWEEKQLAYYWITADRKSFLELVRNIQSAIVQSNDVGKVDALDFGRQEAALGRLRKIISKFKINPPC
ncbi:hypothetical protein [Rhizobacter sp. P5_C2]